MSNGTYKQTRTFVHNNAGQLTSSTTPEKGKVTQLGVIATRAWAVTGAATAGTIIGSSANCASVGRTKMWKRDKRRDADSEEELKFIKDLQDSWLFKLTGSEEDPRLLPKAVLWVIPAAGVTLLVMLKLA
jgi:hypothetical protein